MQSIRKLPLGTFKRELRQVARTVLEQKGFQTEERTGKGIRPGARFKAEPAKGPALEVAVRTGRERSLGFSRLNTSSWRTLQSVQLVVAVVPHQDTPGDFEVLAFESKTLKSWYGKALKALESADRAPELAAPVFIPLDEQSKKNLGHNIVGLKKAALWSVRINAQRLENAKLSGDLETFIDRVKREFAERNEVDVSKVSVEFRILA